MLFKKIFLLFNVIGLLLYSLFFEGVTVTQVAPASVKYGEEFTVELTINKGTTSGFAKLQQELPEGVTVRAGETAGGNLTFDNKNVKIIWMSLPSEPSFKVTYKVIVPEGGASQITLGGKFSYLENNEKKVFDLTPTNIAVGGGAGAATAANTTTTQPASTGTTTTTTQPASTGAATGTQGTTGTETAAITTPAPTGTTGTTTGTTPVSTGGNTRVSSPEGNVMATREMPANTTAKEFVVNITVKKGAVGGFAKIEETLPAGLTATNVESAAGVFSFVDQKVKYLWMSLPADAEFKVSYKVNVEASYTATTASISGLFSYLENDETKKAEMPASTVSFTAPTEAATATTTQPAATGATGATGAATGTETTAARTTETGAGGTSGTAGTTATETGTGTAANNETASETTAAAITPKVTSTPPAQQGILFRVQVSATHKNVPNTWFNENYKVSGEVYSEMHEGWYKYTTGGYNQYAQARDKRVELSANPVIPGPFVTAYNSGKRITVQEALMISNQKWVR